MTTKGHQSTDFTTEALTLVTSLAGGYDSVCASQVEELLFKAYSASDDLLGALLTGLKMNSAPIWQATLEEFSCIADFFIDSTNKQVARFSRQAINKSRKTDILENLLDRHNGDLEGVQLSTQVGTLHLIFSREAYQEGGYRISYFSEYGFSNHKTRGSYKELVNEAVEDNYVIETDNKLDELSRFPQFH